MPKEEIMKELILNIKTAEDAVNTIIEHCPFSHRDMSLVIIGGSRKNGTFGPQSDLDVVTIMKTGDPKKVDVEPILEVGTQLNRICSMIHRDSPITPVVIATIRLEEAQIELARITNPGRIILPVHWVHYPSIQFMATNEPIDLAKGLLGGTPLLGDTCSFIEELQHFAKNPVQEVAGLDWLTDSFRILIANHPADGENPRFPVGFLRRHATHNLHYFWKWRIVAPMVEKITGFSDSDWSAIQKVAQRERPDLMSEFQKVHILRHLGEKANLDDIVNLHKDTFSTWREIC